MSTFMILEHHFYLDKMLRREIKNKKDTTKGTLLFPAHSSQDTPQKVNHLKLIKEIESVSEGYIQFVLLL